MVPKNIAVAVFFVLVVAAASLASGQETTQETPQKTNHEKTQEESDFDRGASENRPTMIVTLKDGKSYEGKLERFDDGEYWIRVEGERVTFNESDVTQFRFLRAEIAKLEPVDREIVLLLEKFFRPIQDSSGERHAVDVRLIPEIAAHGKRAIRPLLNGFGKYDKDYQAVGEVLFQMGPEVLPLLVECVREDAGRSARFPVWWAIRKHGVDQTDFIADLLKDDDPRIRLLGMEVLYSWSTTSGVAIAPSIVPSLVKILDDSDDDVRNQAPLILSRIGFQSEHVLPTLLNILEDDKYAAVRSNAVIGLGYMGSELEGDDPDFLKIQTALVKSLQKDPSPNIRYYSALYLGGFGPRAVAALPALRDATNDKAELVRDYAATAIKKIER